MCAERDWQEALMMIHDAPEALQSALGPVYFHRMRELIGCAEDSRIVAAQSTSPLERTLAEHDFDCRAREALALMAEIAGP